MGVDADDGGDPFATLPCWFCCSCRAEEATGTIDAAEEEEAVWDDEDEEEECNDTIVKGADTCCSDTCDPSDASLL